MTQPNSQHDAGVDPAGFAPGEKPRQGETGPMREKIDPHVVQPRRGLPLDDDEIVSREFLAAGLRPQGKSDDEADRAANRPDGHRDGKPEMHVDRQ